MAVFVAMLPSQFLDSSGDEDTKDLNSSEIPYKMYIHEEQ